MTTQNVYQLATLFKYIWTVTWPFSMQCKHIRVETFQVYS